MEIKASVFVDGSHMAYMQGTYTIAIGELQGLRQEDVANYTITWGDGTTTTLTPAQLDAARREARHIYPSLAFHRILIEVTTKSGARLTAAVKECTVIWADCPLRLEGPTQATAGETYAFTFGPDSPESSWEQAVAVSYTIDWGDGTSTTVTPGEFNAAGRRIEHVFNESGPRRCTLTVTDKAGAQTRLADHCIFIYANESDDRTILPPGRGNLTDAALVLLEQNLMFLGLNREPLSNVGTATAGGVLAPTLATTSLVQRAELTETASSDLGDEPEAKLIQEKPADAPPSENTAGLRLDVADAPLGQSSKPGPFRSFTSAFARRWQRPL